MALNPRTVQGVTKWIRVAAYAVPLLVLPSALFRLKVAVTGPVCDPRLSTGTDHALGLGESLYVISLSVLSMLLACLTVGLVERWGEVVPQWVPWLGGRRIPIMAAVIPAALGTIVMSILTLWQIAISVFDITNPSADTTCVFPQDGAAEIVLTLVYLPVGIWPVLLGIVTAAYFKRRRRCGS